ncbi:MAG: transcriptional regulator [Candidatus Poribacteria bacterium]|nr:transcriptional regulator [Candidatus Poribacteria bacterium]
MKKLTTWHEFLIEKLANREEAISYLQVSLEEYLVDGDTPFFLKGIRNVVEAQGGIPEVAKQAGITPKALSEFLSSRDPLNLGTLSAVLKALGWQLSIEPLSAERNSSELANEQLTPSNEPLETSTEQIAESHSAYATEDI